MKRGEAKTVVVRCLSAWLGCSPAHRGSRLFAPWGAHTATEGFEHERHDAHHLVDP